MLASPPGEDAAAAVTWAGTGAVEASDTGTGVDLGGDRVVVVGWGHSEVAMPLSAPSIPHRAIGAVTPLPGLLPGVPIEVVVPPVPVHYPWPRPRGPPSRRTP